MARDFKFQLPEKAQIGQIELRPGTYSLSVDGQTVVLKDKSGKTIDVKAKVEETDTKASDTRLGLSQDHQLVSVTLSGTRTRVVFQ